MARGEKCPEGEKQGEGPDSAERALTGGLSDKARDSVSIPTGARCGRGYLHGGVEERHCVEHRLPHGQVTDVQGVLVDPGKCPLQACAYALGRLVSELERSLSQKANGNFVSINYDKG